VPYILVTPPTDEPLTLEAAKAHLRVETGEDDALITTLIAAARDYVERETNRSIMPQVWRLALDRFPRGPIVLSHGPVRAVSAVTYRDTSDVAQTMTTDDYLVDELPNDYPRMVPSVDEIVWPGAQAQPGAVTVTFSAGYAAAANVPQAIIQAIKLMVGHWYANREAVGPSALGAVPLAADSLIHSYRIPLLS
jgi:uncharacterized phiE125 gp8 family phage protein